MNGYIEYRFYNLNVDDSGRCRVSIINNSPYEYTDDKFIESVYISDNLDSVKFVLRENKTVEESYEYVDNEMQKMFQYHYID